MKFKIFQNLLSMGRHRLAEAALRGALAIGTVAGSAEVQAKPPGVEDVKKGSEKKEKPAPETAEPSVMERIRGLSDKDFKGAATKIKGKVGEGVEAAREAAMAAAQKAGMGAVEHFTGVSQADIEAHEKAKNRQRAAREERERKLKEAEKHRPTGLGAMSNTFRKGFNWLFGGEGPKEEDKTEERQ